MWIEIAIDVISSKARKFEDTILTGQSNNPSSPIETSITKVALNRMIKTGQRLLKIRNKNNRNTKIVNVPNIKTSPFI